MQVMHGPIVCKLCMDIKGRGEWHQNMSLFNNCLSHCMLARVCLQCVEEIKSYTVSLS